MSKNIKNNMNPLLPFIQERVNAVRKEIEADLFLWLSGKKYPNLKFDGSLVLVYWGPYLEGHIYKIIETAFTANRELAAEQELDPANFAADASLASQEAIINILNKMADYDQRMRGEGYPQRVVKKDIIEIKERYFRIVQTRAANEVTLLNMPKKNIVKLPLTSEHGLYWFIKNCHWSVYPVLLGLILGAFALGLGAGRNDSFLRVYDAVKSAFSTQPISQPATAPTPLQNNNNIKK